MPGVDIACAYGDNGREMALMLCQKLGVLGEEANLSDAVIGIKPNLVCASPPEQGATTDPGVVEGIIIYLQEMGAHSIKILESAQVGTDTKRAFRVCGYNRMAARYGASLIDLKDDSTATVDTAAGRIAVFRQLLELDYLINVPVLKAHCQTKLTCALKNLKGCIPDSEKRRFHREGLHKLIAALGAALRPDLVVVDAIYGDISFELGGNPLKMDRVIAGRDPLLVDAYAATLLGYDPEEIDHLRYAAELGAGTLDLGRAMVSEYKTDKGSPISNHRQAPQHLLPPGLVKEEGACSACYANLVHALRRLGQRSVSNLPGSVHIGQGYRGQNGQGVGIGTCTAGFCPHLPGCPPPTNEILSFLKTIAVGDR